MRKELSVTLSALTLTVGVTVFMSANAEPLYIDQQLCGEVQSVTLSGGVVKLSGVTGCVIGGGTTPPVEGETTPPVEGETTPPVEGETTPPGPVNPVLGGINKSAVWAPYTFPIVSMANERVGKAGGKYHYYKFDVSSAAYAGAIAFGPAPGSGNAAFNVWISSQPGQVPVAGSACSSSIANNSTLGYVMNLNAASDRKYCKLTTGTYYLNIADGLDVSSGAEGSSVGNCSVANGCAYYIEVTGTRK